MTTVTRSWWVAAGMLLAMVALVAVVPWRAVPQGSPVRLPGSGFVRRVQSAVQALQPASSWPPLVAFDYTVADLRGQDLHLLTDPRVLTNLKLTQRQRSGVEQLLESLRQDLWRLWSSVGRRPEARASLTEPIRRMRQRSHAQVFAVLTGEQEKRLRQIGLQHMGLRNTLQREDVAAALNLAPQQRETLRVLLAEKLQASAPLRQAFEQSSTGPERLGAHEGLMELQERIDARAAAVLTDEQWTQLQQMVGPPFRSWPVRQVSQTSSATAQAELKAESERRLKKLGLALRMYAQDWSMVLPPMEDAQSAKKALSPYLRTLLPPTKKAQAATGPLASRLRRDDTVFLDPQTDTPYRPNAAVSRHQVYGPVRIQGPGPQQGQVWRVRRGQHPDWMKVKGYIPVSQENGKVAFYEPEAGPDGSRAVLFLDGRVARVGAAEWQRLMRGSRVPSQTP